MCKKISSWKEDGLFLLGIVVLVSIIYIPNQLLLLRHAYNSHCVIKLNPPLAGIQVSNMIVIQIHPNNHQFIRLILSEGSIEIVWICQTET